MPGGDYYHTLGVSRDADSQAIRKAFLLRTKVLHPDRFDQKSQAREWDLANDLLKELNHAYAVLSDPRARADYDRSASSKVSTTPVGPSPDTMPRSGPRTYFRRPSLRVISMGIILVIFAGCCWYLLHAKHSQKPGDNWSSFSLPDSSFTISSPDALAYHQRKMASAAGLINIDDYNTVIHGVRYSVACYTFPRDAASKGNPSSVLDELDGSIAESLHGKIGEESDTFPGNKLQRKFSILVPDRNQIVLLHAWYWGEDHAIVVSAGGKLDSIPNSTTDRFFGSVVFPNAGNSSK